MLLLLGDAFPRCIVVHLVLRVGGGWGRRTLQADKQRELLAIMMSAVDDRIGSKVAIEET